MKQIVSAFLSLALIFSAMPLMALPIPSHPTDNCKKHSSQTECLGDCNCIWSTNQICVSGDNASQPCIQGETTANMILIGVLAFIGLVTVIGCYYKFFYERLPTADDYSVNGYEPV